MMTVLLFIFKIYLCEHVLCENAQLKKTTIYKKKVIVKLKGVHYQ